MVYARKARQIGVADSFQAGYKSATSQSARDLYVATKYLGPADRVLVIDDFLAGGATADALLRICRMAGAQVVGGGFLIEKVNEAGRALLSGAQVPFESLTSVSVEDGRLQILEAEPETGPEERDFNVADS